MNYRHDYHAGNFADVVKHIVLTLVLTYLKHKSQPFRVIDTHAGPGRYDLGGPEAKKTGEWRDGIGRILNADMPAHVAELVAPYLQIVRDFNEPGQLNCYPGSPSIARQLMRDCDTLIANELNPEDFERLNADFRRAKSTTILNIDAWHAVKSLLPPRERRGLVLIDPPFEHRDEFDKLLVAVNEATRRFATGVYMIWYPLKDEPTANRFVTSLIAPWRSEYLDVRLSVSAPFPGLGLTAAGVLVLNPPFVLKSKLEAIMPMLAERLANGAGGGFDLRSTMDAR